MPILTTGNTNVARCFKIHELACPEFVVGQGVCAYLLACLPLDLPILNDDWHVETDDPLYADAHNFYKVELWGGERIGRIELC